MATNRDIIERAYRKIGVVAKDEPMDADDAEVGIAALNGMLAGWSLRDVFVIAEEMGINDDFPLSLPYHEGCVYMLASRLSPDYQAPANFDADDWFRTFQAAYFEAPTVAMPRSILRTPSQRRDFEEI